MSDMVNSIKGMGRNVTYSNVLLWWSRIDKTSGSENSCIRDFIFKFIKSSCAIDGVTIRSDNIETLYDDDILENFTGTIKGIMSLNGYCLAIKFMNEELKERHPITRELILKVHEIAMDGCYDKSLHDKGECPGMFRNKPMDDGSGINPRYIEEMVDSSIVEQLTHNIIGNALRSVSMFHCLMEKIVPFADGNDKLCRLMMNYSLMLNGHPPINIEYADRKAYFHALSVFMSSSDCKELERFLEYCTVETWRNYVDLHGGY